MESFLNNIRHKSEGERRRLAVIATAVSFAVIFLVWVPFRFGLVSGSRETAGTDENSAAETPVAVPDAFDAVIVSPPASTAGADLFGDAMTAAEESAAIAPTAAPAETPVPSDLNSGDTSL